MKHTCSRHFLFFLIFSIISTISFSQNEAADNIRLFNVLQRHMFSNKDSTYFYASKIIDNSKKDKNYEHMLYALLFSNKSATYFNDYIRIKINLGKIDSLFSNYSPSIDTIASLNTIKMSTSFDKGNYYYRFNNYSTSQKHFFALLSTSKKVPDSILTKQDTDLIIITYATIAKMHSNDGKYTLAKEYYNKSIRFINKIKDDNKQQKLSNLNRLIGKLHQRQKDFKTSNKYLTKSLNFSLNIEKEGNSIVNEAYSIVENFIALKQPDSAKFYLKYIEPFKDSNIPYGFMFYKARAKLNSLNNNNETIEEDYSTVITLLKNKWKDHRHPEIANAYHEFSNYYLSNNNITEALSQNQLAIDQVHGENIINSSINNSEYLKLLRGRINIETKSENFNEILKTSTLALSVLDSLKPSFKNNTDKMLLVDNAFPIFENSLNALSKLHKGSKDTNYTKQAFNLIEKSKSTLLLEALLSAKATNYADIPETIIEQEQLFKIEITTLEKRLERSKNEALEEQLFKQKNNYLKFINDLEANYKSYYNLKYNTKVVELETFQKFLNEDDRLLSYFYGESALFLMNVTKNKSTFSRIAIDESFNNLIKEVYTLLGNPKSDLQLLNFKSHELYNKIIAPYLEDGNKENLIILPDGLLNYIPFSALVSNKDEAKYLIEDYSISYANSATLLLQLQSKKENNNQILAFAPTFENTNLLALPNNKKEANQVLTHFKGKAFESTAANLDHFNTFSSNYSILHLATHAIFNDATPENSYLVFAKNDTNNNVLYVRDLYNLKLNADLVTLSACESGIGNLNRGEGLMSIARGFYFSGANSIASTLWKINDASTTKLMDNFYSNLSKNDTKNAALQKAQLQFIDANKENALSHPYYWSGFVISGNTATLGTTNYFLWIGFAILLLILLLLYFKRRT